MEEPTASVQDWLRLAHCKHISPPDKIAWLARSPSPADCLTRCRPCAWGADTESLIERDLAWLDGGSERGIIPIIDRRYPALLRHIPDPPLLLYYRGNRAVLTLPLLAVVGSRSPTPAGRQHATHFATGLAQAGIGVVSGLALGIDGAAHRGSLARPNAAIAVCATGLDQVYPRRHEKLAREVADSGVLLSEMPVGSPPRRAHFPQRNRIISGLALGTLVVEAGIRSGSLITARNAAEQGRDVFALPGSIHSARSQGCHLLIKQGAKLVESVADILAELSLELEGFLDHSPGPGAAVATQIDEPMILRFLGFDPASVDELVQRSGLTADRVSSMLSVLEVEGKVSACPGGRYVRTC